MGQIFDKPWLSKMLLTGGRKLLIEAYAILRIGSGPAQAILTLQKNKHTKTLKRLVPAAPNRK